ncbi:MAG TPA: DUF6624 domain-containing protein [Allosphingosinicella sp.]|nr:DUF6624 domain-containing protein [Allosphingosinicella sp.]
MRTVCLVIAAFWLVAAAPPPPPVLDPYIRDGRFDPGDYGWMRGWFAGASAAETRQRDSVRDWLDRCHREGLAVTRAELRAMGITEPGLGQSDFRDSVCAQVASAATLPGVTSRSFAEFQSAVSTARPIADSFLLATRIAEGVGGPRGPSLTDRLLARALGEQVIRIGMAWGQGDLDDAPPLEPDVKAIVMARFAAAAGERDHVNTAWLKEVVEKEGWPVISKVGGPAAQQAWLLVQHADADPAFQLKVLRLMDPLTRTGEVSKSNYAYLYDRVMLKLTGRQRYATQLRCRDGKRVAQPLEDEGAVGRERARMELEPLARYLASLDKTFGPCPPEPGPTSR